METYPFICEGKTCQAYGYLPFKDFPEDLYNYFCKGGLYTYDRINTYTNFDVVLLLRDRFPGITRWNFTPYDSTQGLPLLTLNQLKEIAFIDSLEN